MIAQERIESARAIPLAQVLQSKGIQAEQRGHQFIAKCPFHDDHDPSLSIDTRTNLFKCFGCGAAGDTIRFIELYENLSFPQAVASLVPEPQAAQHVSPAAHRKRRSPATPAPTSQPQAASPTSSINPQQLLNRVTELYHTTLLQEDASRNYLAKRGIANPELYRRLRSATSAAACLTPYLRKAQSSQLYSRSASSLPKAGSYSKAASPCRCWMLTAIRWACMAAR